MNARVRSTAVLLLASSALLLAACDSDNTGEPDLVSFSGVYVAEGRFDGAALQGGIAARGTCCFRLEVDMGNDAEGDVSGAGTLTYLTEDGTESGAVFPVSVGGTTSGDAVALTLAFNAGNPTAFTLAFEGTVEQGGSSITGTFAGAILDGQTLTLVREPLP